MLCREKIGDFSEIYRKHISTMCLQNIELLSFELLVYKQWPLGFQWLIYITRKFSS